MLSFVLIAIAIGGLVLPPLFVYSLITHHHPAGALALMAAWVLYIVWIGRKLMRARPPEDS